MASALAGWGALIVLADAIRTPDLITDQAQVWVAARELAQGHNPYDRIGPGRAWPLMFDFYYPLTAPLLSWPLRNVSPAVMQVVFVAVSSFLLAWGVTKDGWHRVPIFLSPAFVASAKVVQWTPVLGAVLWLPWLGFVLAAKPNLGLVILAGVRSWRAFWLASALALALTVVSLLLWPGWVMDWRRTLAGADHFVPTILYPGGAILLLAGLRWRDWRGRLLLAMALVPQTPGPAAALLLLLIPQTLRGVLVLSVLTALPFFAVPGPEAFATYAEHARVTGLWTLWAVYVPALVLLLYEPSPAHRHPSAR